MTRLDAARAAAFARLTLGHIDRPYPYKPDIVLTSAEDLALPIARHPIFHGSFDWHSCVHGWWQLLTIARTFPDLPESAAIRTRADIMLTPETVEGELASLAHPASGGFARPYGWAWALALHGEAARHRAGWGPALEPLARLFATRFAGYLPKLTYPIRVGTHFNTAFALILAHDWAGTYDPALARLIEERGRTWFGRDRACQAWEPSGDDFLSSALTEAVLMARILSPDDHAEWFAAFLPDLAEGEPATLFTPAIVSDRRDGKIAHLDGLNLGRAWCWRTLAATLGPAHPIRIPALDTAERHLTASLPHLADDYMGSHWLATFALLALMA